MLNESGRSALVAIGAALWMALALTLAATGRAAAQEAPPATPTLYERVGGMPAIRAVVDDAIVNISADERINGRFGNATAPNLARNLAELLCERTGGPCKYTGRDMASAHDGMYIRDAEFDALVEDLAKSIDKFHVPARERAELMALFGKMRNAIVGH